MNTARVEVERDGTSTVLKEEVLDPLASLITVAGPVPRATVGMSVGTQFDFGRVKVTAHVSYQCDQTTAMVDRAGLLAYEKAVSFMNDGLQLLTTPGEPTG